MSISLGIFDLLTIAVPGALQLSVLFYVAYRLHWVELPVMLQIPSGVLFVGLALSSYLLGHLAYGLGGVVDRLAESRSTLRWDRARASFVAGTPTATDRPFVQRNPYLLLAALELQAREAALEISRLRAAGLMLRSCGAAFVQGTVVALVELYMTPRRYEAAAVALVLVLATLMAVRRSHQLRDWARTKTFQLAYWLPGIDERLSGSVVAPARVAPPEGPLLVQPAMAVDDPAT
jgi:hypothetical protein